MSIDAVVTWVDGNDVSLSEKRRQYSTDGAELQREDLGGKTRFADRGEIHWLIASINRFAPWVRRIFIVTDGQDPMVESRIPVEIVDHKVIFRGYESFLPCFNSLGIETMLWRIPGLCEKFIYFNDDLMLLRPVCEGDFFTPEGKAICYGPSVPAAWIQLLHDLKPKVGNERPVTVKHSLLNSAKIAGSRKVLFLNHTPKGFDRVVLENLFGQRPELLERNISSRFRSLEQYRMDELYYLLTGAPVRPHKDVLFYYEPRCRKGHIKAKIASLRSGKHLFACFNSLDKAPGETFETLRAEIGRILEA